MKRDRTVFLVLTAAMAAGLTLAQTETKPGLDRKTGKIYKVNTVDKSFEYITTTAYNPQSDEGRTRFTVWWDDKTKFISVKPLKGFDGLEGTRVGRFYYLDSAQVKAIKAGKSFTCRNVEIQEGLEPTGFRRDEKALTARFSPGKRAMVEVDGKRIPFRFQKKTSVQLIRNETADYLKRGLFKARIFGKEREGRFVLSSVRLTPLPDPRKTDDPKLPRMLVIGDSISMNYDAAVRRTLAGVVNYHRIDGNGGPSIRGVESMDLWLGNYREKGFGWDIIQFNHGLHDLKRGRMEDGGWGENAATLEQYKKNLEKEIAMLKKTGAVLIWATTTPVPNDSSGGSARKKDEDIPYNKAAMEVISRHPEILVTDLNRAVRESAVFDEWRKGDNVHFKSEGELTVLGDTIVATVKKVLKKETK